MTITITSTTYKGQSVLVGTDDEGHTIGPVASETIIDETSDSHAVAEEFFGGARRIVSVDHDRNFVHATVED